MNTPPTQNADVVQRPKVFACFRAGFDSIANHIELLLFPLALDLLLWLGPHFSVRSVVEDATRLLNQVVSEEGSLPVEAIEATRETWQFFAEHFNLLALLRTLPVGIPSLMAGRSPIETPFGSPAFLELTALPAILLLVLLVVVIGLALGALFYLLVIQASTTNHIDWGTTLREWPLAAARSVGLLLLLIALLAVVSIPASCVLGLLALSGLMVSQIGILIYAMILAWWMFPLVFSAHGIFLYRDKLWHSILRSIRVTRLTFPITGTLIMLVFLLSEGLDMLWNTPKADSWLMLLGVVGHAFVTTALLAASFVYYDAMNRWLQAQAQVDLNRPPRGESV